MTLDTSVWIPYLRGVRYRRVVDDLVSGGRVWLPSVVLLELYAGAASVEDKRAVDSLRDAAASLGHVTHPSELDFALAGQILAYHAQHHGALRPRDHSHDLLIAIAAARTTGLLLTENVSDMTRWANALRRRARLRVRVVRPRAA